MTSILLCSIIVSLFTLGLKISTGADMVLSKVRVFLDRQFIEVKTSKKRVMLAGKRQTVKEITTIVSDWYYPILYCIKCMPSVYGTLLSLLLLPFTLHLLYQIPLVIFCSVTLNCVIYQMYE